MKVAVTILVFCVAALLALGMVMLYSSSMGMAQVGAHLLAMQLVWCVLGLAAAVVTTMVDYRKLKKIWWVLLGAAILMLVLVLNKHYAAVRVVRVRRALCMIVNEIAEIVSVDN